MPGVLMQGMAGGEIGNAGGMTGGAIRQDQGFQALVRSMLAGWRVVPLSQPAIHGIRTRSKRLAGALALHWFAGAFKMALADRLRPLRHRAGICVVVGLCALALTGALFFPESGSARQSQPEPVVLPETRVVAAAQPPAKASEPFADLRSVIGPDVWTPVKRPIAMYNLEAPELEATELTQRIAMRGKATRQDAMTWVARADRKGTMTRPVIHLVVERFEASAPTFRPLFSDLAARAAAEGVAIDRMNAPGEITTKFGVMEVADAVLATDQGVFGCLLYRRNDTIGLALAGWYCGTAQRPADRVSLGCFIDRLDLVGAGQDSMLKRHFASAERNRTSCAGARQPGRRLTWLDHEAPMPTLKLSAIKR